MRYALFQQSGTNKKAAEVQFTTLAFVSFKEKEPQSMLICPAKPMGYYWYFQESLPCIKIYRCVRDSSSSIVNGGTLDEPSILIVSYALVHTTSQELRVFFSLRCNAECLHVEHIIFGSFWQHRSKS